MPSIDWKTWHLVVSYLKTNFRKYNRSAVYLCAELKLSHAGKTTNGSKASKCFCDGEKYCLSIYNSHRAWCKNSSKKQIFSCLDRELLLPVIWGISAEHWTFSTLFDTSFLLGEEIRVSGEVLTAGSYYLSLPRSISFFNEADISVLSFYHWNIWGLINSVFLYFLNEFCVIGVRATPPQHN